MNRLAAALFGLTCLLCAPCPAQTPEIPGPQVSSGWQMDYFSRYVWRGIVYSRGPVGQPSVWVTRGDLTFTAWGNGNLASRDGRDINEGDFSLTKDRQWRRVGVESGFQLYTYPHQTGAPATGEASLKLSLPTGQFVFYASQSFDVIRYAGSVYVEIGVTTDRAWGRRTSWGGALSLGAATAKFNRIYLGVDRPALNVAGAEISLTYHLDKTLSVRPRVGITSLLDPRLRRQTGEPTVVVTGITLGWNL